MSFVIYDLETTGLNRRFDQILHFAAIKTDEKLRATSSIELKCRLLPYVVPSPKALALTGATVRNITSPLRPSHYEMVCDIQRKLAEWSPALFLGYNSIRFDEEFLRQAFYQCLHPTYLTNTNSNARADVLNLMRAVACLRPGVLNVPVDSEGRQIYKLADLAAANGITNRGAHDAMRDVELTVQLCQRVQEGAADIWSTYLRFASKPAVVAFISEEPAFGYFDNFDGVRSVRPLTRIGTSLADSNAHYCLDLTKDIDAYRRLSDDELREAMANKANSPIRRLKVNGAPFVCPLWELDANNLAPSDEGELIRLANRVRADDELMRRLQKAARAADPIYPPSEHVELQIYSGAWPSEEDATRCRLFHLTPWEQRLDIVAGFADPRFLRLGRRLVYLERPDLLRPNDRAAFDKEVARRIHGGDGDFPWTTLPRAMAQLEELVSSSRSAEHAALRALGADLRSVIGAINHG